MSIRVNGPKPTRKEKAAATRERMLAAATDVFGEAGYTGARMTDIAERAGVAVQTVYFTFHTKGELLQACLDRAVLGPLNRPPEQQDFYADITRSRTGRSALRAFARGVTEILERVAAIKEVAESSTDADAAAIAAHSERLRRDGYRDVLRLVTKRSPLRRGLDIDTATDLLMMFSSTSTYLTLRRYGWSNEQYAKWLADTLSEQLLGP